MPSKTIQALFFITLIGLLGLNSQNILKAYEHHYFISEPDAYLHLVFAQDFLQHPSLSDHFSDRINTPIGADTHAWTRLMTLILAGGALCLHLFLSLQSALYGWAFFLPIIANFFAICAMIWAISPLKPTVYQQCFVILAFLINPFLHHYFLPLRVDYDCILIPLSIVYWGLILRLLSQASFKQTIATGLIASLALWCSISFMIPLLISIGFLFWQNINHKIDNKIIYSLLCAIIIGLIPMIYLEQTPFINEVHDIISIVHLTLFILMLSGYTLFQHLTPKSFSLKIMLIFLLVILVFLCMNDLFPAFYIGPYKEASPFILQHFIFNTSESYSPFAIDNALSLSLLAYFFIGAGYFYFLAITDGLSAPEAFLLFISCALSAFTAYMFRWFIFSVPLSIWLVSFVLPRLKQNFNTVCGLKPKRDLSIIILLFTAYLPNGLLSFANEYANPHIKGCEEQLFSMLDNQFFDAAQFSKDKSLFIHSNYGPLLLYMTHFSVLATNDHHNSQGYKDSYDVFNEKETIAKNIIYNRHINLLLICPSWNHLKFNPEQADWLKPIHLPSAYSKWQLYRVYSS